MIATFELVGYALVSIVLVPVAAFTVILARYLGLWAQFEHAARDMGVRWWDAVGPLVLFAGVVAIAFLAGTVPGEGDPGYLSFIFGLALALLGAIGAIMALGNADEYRQLTAAADSAGSVDTGPTLLTGEARPDGEPLKGALSDEPAVVQTLRITERRGLGYRKSQAELHFERSSAPFHLDDGRGAVTVDHTDGAVRYEGSRSAPDERLSLPAEDDSERAIVERISDRTGVDPDEDQQYREFRIEPGTDVTVLGTVTRDPEARYPVVQDGDRRLVVFEGAIDEARATVASRVRWGTVATLLCLPGGAFWMLSVAGAL